MPSSSSSSSSGGGQVHQVLLLLLWAFVAVRVHGCVHGCVYMSLYLHNLQVDEGQKVLPALSPSVLQHHPLSISINDECM